MKDNNEIEYAYEAARIFNEIMASSHKSKFANINSENKGELFVLKYLFESKCDIMPSKLSDAMNTSNARISALLATLEKKNQITREIDPNNRRNILVSITKEGSKRIEEELSRKKEMLIKIFIDMGKEDTEEFIRLSKNFTILINEHFNK